MAKKAVATFKKGDGRTYSKVIKNGCYLYRFRPVWLGTE